MIYLLNVLLSGAGTSTTAIGFGGSPDATGATEEWNADFAYGVWATGGSLNTARSYMGGAGITTASLTFGGETSTAQVTLTEAYNGTAWAELNNMNTARAQLGGSWNTNCSFGLYWGNCYC